MAVANRARFRSQLLLTFIFAAFSPHGLAAKAADGYWLDQFNALIYLGLFRLDEELRMMRDKGTGVVMVQADLLPDPMLRWIAWRVHRAGMKPIAWIQNPSGENLKRVGALKSFVALQIDDHFFSEPPLPLAALKEAIAPRRLWCSFQPFQYSSYIARYCDHVDVQIYRKSCGSTVLSLNRLGIKGRINTALAVYHDGSNADEAKLDCFRRASRELGIGLFVFKWKNNDYLLAPVVQSLPGRRKLAEQE